MLIILFTYFNREAIKLKESNKIMRKEIEELKKPYIHFLLNSEFFSSKFLVISEAS